MRKTNSVRALFFFRLPMMHRWSAHILVSKMGAQVAELMLRPLKYANQGALEEGQILRDNNNESLRQHPKTKDRKKREQSAYNQDRRYENPGDEPIRLP
jgi:hypothetical protein